MLLLYTYYTTKHFQPILQMEQKRKTFKMLLINYEQFKKKNSIKIDLFMAVIIKARHPRVSRQLKYV